MDGCNIRIQNEIETLGFALCFDGIDYCHTLLCCGIAAMKFTIQSKSR
jgi:hypothetical protein